MSKNMNRTDLIEQLEAYTPFCEQEEKDKELILHFLKTNENAFSRQNTMAHITSSSWIVNKEKTKVLMVFHNIYNSFSWTGGHNDNDEDCLRVALKEAKEETGVQHLHPLSEQIFSIEALTVDGHIKKGAYVSCHLHLNITYLLEADENDPLTIKPDENKAVKWIPIEDIDSEVREEWFKKWIYAKLNQKLEKLK